LLELVEKYSAGDGDAWLDELGPEFEFTTDPGFPDAGTYRGEELRRWMREWVRTWQANKFEVLGIDDHGGTMTVESRWHLAAPQAGEEVPLQDFTLVLWFDPEDDERLLRMAAFFDRDRALEVARGPG
jgi:ketosteroid isomerase-like protein